MKLFEQTMNYRRIAVLLLVGALSLGAASCSAPSATPSAAPIATATPVVVLQTLADADRALTLEGYGAQGSAVDEAMTVADMLTYAIQDEYIAHGEYAAILLEFGNVNPYSNIIRSEESHIAFLTDLFLAYGMVLPTDDSASHLVVPASLLDAAKTGVQAEIGNIAMYERFLGEALPLDVLGVFTSLKTASESHLAAFEKQVARLS